MEYHIRAMQEQDIPFVSQIENQIFSLPWSETSFRDAAANPVNVYLVCECTGEIAGYCGMWTVMGEGNVTNVAVHPAYRRRGVAEALLKEIEGQRRHKTGGVLGHDDLHVGSQLAQSAGNVCHFIGGNAAADAQKDAFSLQIHPKYLL